MMVARLDPRGVKGAASAVMLLALAACSESNEGAPPAADGGHVMESDASKNDPSDDRDAGEVPGSDASAETPSCSGGDVLGFVGNYIEADGTKHWLRRSASARTYTRIAAGAADNTKPPRLWKIERACYDQKRFVATEDGATFTRVDWASEGAGDVQLCVAVENAASVDAALAADAPKVGSPTGCRGAAWNVLTPKFGGQ